MSQQNMSELNRRAFLARTGIAQAGLSALNIGVLAFTGCDNPTTTTRAETTADAGHEKTLSWQTRIPPEGEPGTPLLVSGRIFDADGKQPLAGVTLYVYHTDARGIYTERPVPGVDPMARLRGWMKTDRDGRYEFRTIRPASYPNTNIPEHIHAKAGGPGYAERWLDNFWFDDDKLVTGDMRAKFGRGDSFSPIMKVARDGEGILHCVRDIRLEKA
jgi:protocatechuate 3,4-dioxygenase beta subunit